MAYVTCKYRCQYAIQFTIYAFSGVLEELFSSQENIVLTIIYEIISRLNHVQNLLVMLFSNKTILCTIKSILMYIHPRFHRILWDCYRTLRNDSIFNCLLPWHRPNYSTMNFFGTSTVIHVCITYAFAILLGQSCITLLCTIVPRCFYNRCII